MDVRDIFSGEVLFIDIEGDGVGHHRPVEIAIVKYVNRIKVEQYHWLINSGRDIDKYLTERVHKISDQDVKDKPSFYEIEPSLRNILQGKRVVSHGLRNELALLAEVGFDLTKCALACYDSLRLYKAVLPGIKRYGLDAMIEKFGLKFDDRLDSEVVSLTNAPERASGRHGALWDACVAAEGAFKVVDEFALLPEKNKKHINMIFSTPMVASKRLIEETYGFKM